MTTTMSHHDAPEIWMRVTNAQLLARTMKAQKVSGRALSRVAGWRSHTYLQRLLRGEAKTLEVVPAVRIANYLGMPTDAFFMPETSSEARECAKYERKAA